MLNFSSSLILYDFTLNLNDTFVEPNILAPQWWSGKMSCKITNGQIRKFLFYSKIFKTTKLLCSCIQKVSLLNQKGKLMENCM